MIDNSTPRFMASKIYTIYLDDLDGGTTLADAVKANPTDSITDVEWQDIFGVPYPLLNNATIHLTGTSMYYTGKGDASFGTDQFPLPDGLNGPFFWQDLSQVSVAGTQVKISIAFS